jgi:hypothetical protein
MATPTMTAESVTTMVTVRLADLPPNLPPMRFIGPKSVSLLGYPGKSYRQQNPAP